jgi:hypothetical protein
MTPSPCIEAIRPKPIGEQNENHMDRYSLIRVLGCPGSANGCEQMQHLGAELYLELRSDTERHGIEVLMPGPALTVRRLSGP